MNLKLKYILIIFLIIGIRVRIPAQETILPAIQQQEQILKRNPEDMRALKELCFLYLHKADYHKAISLVFFMHILDWGRHILCWEIVLQ